MDGRSRQRRRGMGRCLARLGTVAAVGLATLVVGSAPPAAAATVDRYRVELAAWIPQAGVDGPQPDAKCFGYPLGLASYNGNNHKGFDGSYKVIVSYDFTYDGATWADVATDVRYGATTADDGLCSYRGQATSSGGVRVTAGGVQLWTSTKNPLVLLSPAIDARLDISFRGRDEMLLVHQNDKFPSHGFRVHRNGQVVATAVDHDASCVDVTGLDGAAAIGTGLSTSATAVTHDLDLRVAGQNYFGVCGRTPPARFRFPAPTAPAPTPAPANQVPVPAFTSTRLAGPGNQVRLDGSGSRDPDGQVVNHQWSTAGRALGVGKTIIASLGAVTSAPVTLKVTDNVGAAATTTRTLAVGNRAPVVLDVNPAPNATFLNIRPTLSATARDDDGDPLQYSYRFTGNGVDLSSGWVGGSWQLPPHSIDPGLAYTWTVTVRDNRGGTASRTAAIRIAALPTAKRLVALSTGAGYWQVASDGGVFSYGAAPFHGSLPGLGIRLDNVIGMARTPDDRGYWLVGSDGGVFAFGAAPFAGSLPQLGIRVNNIVGMAPTRTGAGYWLVGADGGVFAFGDAPFHGSMGGRPLNAPVVAMSPTPAGDGYWLGAADGGVFAFGAAPFYGSKGGQPLNAPMVDLQATPSGAGYWLGGADGGVFAYGDARFLGSMAGTPLNGRITSLSPTPTAQGYWLNACDGGVFAYGDAPFYGSNPVYGCRGT